MGRVAFRGQVDHCTRNFTWCLLNTINQLLISRLDVFSSCSEGSTTAQQCYRISLQLLLLLSSH